MQIATVKVNVHVYELGQEFPFVNRVLDLAQQERRLGATGWNELNLVQESNLG